MGGSGSGGYAPTAPANPCENIKFNASVNSPQPDVLDNLVPGEQLSVQVMEGGQGVVVLYKGIVVGALTGSRVAQLLNCLLMGFDYQASVVEISGGQCLVRVEGA